MELIGKELFFEAHEVIVSKTNLKGIITYANDTFALLAEVERKDA